MVSLLLGRNGVERLLVLSGSGKSLPDAGKTSGGTGSAVDHLLRQMANPPGVAEVGELLSI